MKIVLYVNEQTFGRFGHFVRFFVAAVVVAVVPFQSNTLAKIECGLIDSMFYVDIHFPWNKLNANQKEITILMMEKLSFFCWIKIKTISKDRK